MVEGQDAWLGSKRVWLRSRHVAGVETRVVEGRDTWLGSRRVLRVEPGGWWLDYVAEGQKKRLEGRNRWLEGRNRWLEGRNRWLEGRDTRLGVGSRG